MLQCECDQQGGSAAPQQPATEQEPERGAFNISVYFYFDWANVLCGIVLSFQVKQS